MSYSIVTVTWQSEAHLGALVRSMNRHLADTPELIVVDNDSRDDPERAARAWRGVVSVIRLDQNAGFGRAANIGVAAATRDATVLLNPDVFLLDGSLDQLAELAQREHGLFGPRLLSPDRSPQPSASGAPVGLVPWLNAVVPGGAMPRWLRARAEPWRLERRTRVAWLSGACVAARTDLLRELGPFEPALHLYSEDLELGLRAGCAGIPSWFCPEVARLVHVGEGSARQRFPAGSWWELAAANRRFVIERMYGRRRERLAWLAYRVNLELRVAVKRVVGGTRADELDALAAVRTTAAPDTT